MSAQAGEGSVVYVTFCCAEKDESQDLLPAVDRYLSARIKNVHNRAKTTGVPFYIFSGKFGLVYERDRIPWYDHLLTPSEIESHSQLVASQLREKKIRKVVCFSAPPESDRNLQTYISCLRMACERAGIGLEIRFEEV